ncbi:hypothetical protein N7E02_03660 (plasmid) [Aliirhizobium terrae]|uniref:hypothetical protein n=1 Tax=Terrirhizobium terrae TaxID=2926709 RepID=UPI0025785D27|nr:hypothetical protein [Rhizobium sp. CC-CFT758]WJH38524.1 hypothetical protein N7E02_03660 [Rhizobium sp. CC-CFT758]
MLIVGEAPNAHWGMQASLTGTLCCDRLESYFHEEIQSVVIVTDYHYFVRLARFQQGDPAILRLPVPYFARMKNHPQPSQRPDFVSGKVMLF